MKIQVMKAVVAGLVGTFVMTLVAAYGAPMMGLPKMDVPGMLAGVMGNMAVLGWMAHLMVGTLLAIGYAVVSPYLPGHPVMRGAIYGVAPWLLAQVMVMPIMGMGFFSGAFAPAFGSLIGHMIYGAVVGVVYGAPQRASTSD